MAIAIEMPKMSDTMEEGLLVAWLVEEGAELAAGDIIAQVETDKATMDLEVYDDGVLLKKVVPEGSGIPIGGLIAILGAAGEDISAIINQYDGVEIKSSAISVGGSAPVEEEAEPEAPAVSADGGRIKATPLARRMAKDQGLDLSGVSGSGPDGRIIKKDIETLLAGGSLAAKPAEAAPVAAPVSTPTPARSPAKAAVVTEGGYDAVKITPMRKTIARRLSESKFTAPHFYLNVDVDMSLAMSFRAQLNELALAQEMSKVSFNDLVVKSCALALKQHPNVNSSWMEAEGEIRRHHEVHVAVAVAVEDGLLTPVVRHADQKGLSSISSEVRRLAGLARDKKLQPTDWEGSTFTTSNLGMFGIEDFTAIVNPPNSCILAIGAIRDVPVVKDGQVVPGKRMKITLSCDHRVVDGATGAKFLGTVKNYLENPMNMML